jgi:hypothetical protein
MASFYRFQRVRIVQANEYPRFVGLEATVLNPNATNCFGEPRVEIEIDGHPFPAGGGWYAPDYCLEPIKYLPAPEDFVSIEASPDFSCPLPAVVGGA